MDNYYIITTIIISIYILSVIITDKTSTVPTSLFHGLIIWSFFISVPGFTLVDDVKLTTIPSEVVSVGKFKVNIETENGVVIEIKNDKEIDYINRDQYYIEKREHYSLFGNKPIEDSYHLILIEDEDKYNEDILAKREDKKFKKLEIK